MSEQVDLSKHPNTPRSRPMPRHRQRNTHTRWHIPSQHKTNIPRTLHNHKQPKAKSATTTNKPSILHTPPRPSPAESEQNPEIQTQAYGVRCSPPTEPLRGLTGSLAHWHAALQVPLFPHAAYRGTVALPVTPAHTPNLKPRLFQRAQRFHASGNK